MEALHTTTGMLLAAFGSCDAVVAIDSCADTYKIWLLQALHKIFSGTASVRCLCCMSVEIV